MRHAYIVCNGILTDSDNVEGWTDIFEDYYQNEGYFCSRYEYTSGLFKSFFQGKRVKDIAKICNRINRPLNYVGHSNGCDIFSRLIKDTEVRFESAHLFSAATSSDFDRNGFNYGLITKRVKKLYLYCSERDLVLRDLASKTTFLNKIGLGYGTLGYTGPTNVLPQVESRVSTTWKNEFRHSSWFSPENIQESFQLTLRK